MTDTNSTLTITEELKMGQQKKEFISILTFPESKEVDERSMFPSAKRIYLKASTVAVETVADNLSRFVGLVGKIITSIPDPAENYEVDTLSFSINLDGSGKVSLVGEVSAGFNSGITLTFKKRNIQQ